MISEFHPVQKSNRLLHPSMQVNNKYVVNKLSRILYPLGTKSWTRVKDDDQYSGSMSTGGVSNFNVLKNYLKSCSYLIIILLHFFSCWQVDASTTHKYALPKNDINAPDLYIPLMSFITYVLLVGYCKGASNKFTPEDLVNAVWRCLLLQLCECALIKFGVSSMQANIPFMDIFAYTGYKYIGLCIGLIALVFGQSFFFLVTMVMSLSLGYFVMKTLAFAIPEKCVGFLPRPVMIIVFAGLQSFVFCLLSL